MADDLRSDETKYIDAEIVRAVARERAEQDALEAENVSLNASLRIANEANERLRTEIDRLRATEARLRAALEVIAGFGLVNLAGEYEHGLRDIIRSIINCANRSLEQSTTENPK